MIKLIQPRWDLKESYWHQTSEQYYIFTNISLRFVAHFSAHSITVTPFRKMLTASVKDGPPDPLKWDSRGLSPLPFEPRSNKQMPILILLLIILCCPTPFCSFHHSEINDQDRYISPPGVTAASYLLKISDEPNKSLHLFFIHLLFLTTAHAWRWWFER